MATLRERIYERLKAALGDPEISPVKSGDLYRWTLGRNNDLNMYVTMDSPEITNAAHIMVSDGLRYQPKPVVATVVYSVEEAKALIERILQQWKRAPHSDGGTASAPPTEEIGGRGDGGLPPSGWKEERKD